MSDHNNQNLPINPYNNHDHLRNTLLNQATSFPRETEPQNMHSMWGHSTIQPPVEKYHPNFTAENLSHPLSNRVENKKEDDDFERSISMNSNTYYVEKNDKLSHNQLYNRENLGEINKMERETQPYSFLPYDKN